MHGVDITLGFSNPVKYEWTLGPLHVLQYNTSVRININNRKQNNTANDPFYLLLTKVQFASQLQLSQKIPGDEDHHRLHECTGGQIIGTCMDNISER